MDIVKAAKLLNAHLLTSPWLTAVGVGTHDGSPAIVLYVTHYKKPELAFLHDGWHGLPVVVRISGRPHASDFQRVFIT